MRLVCSRNDVGIGCRVTAWLSHKTNQVAFAWCHANPQPDSFHTSCHMKDILSAQRISYRCIPYTVQFRCDSGYCPIMIVSWWTEQRYKYINNSKQLVEYGQGRLE